MTFKPNITLYVEVEETSDLYQRERSKCSLTLYTIEDENV